MMLPTITLSNGITLKIRERASCISLGDHTVETSHTGGNKVRVHSGDKVEVRHWPPGSLTLVKVGSSERVRDIVVGAQEDVHFELTKNTRKTQENNLV